MSVAQFGTMLLAKAKELQLDQRPIQGCTQSQIDEIKLLTGVDRFPEVYVQFLRYFGVASGNIFPGTDIHYDSIPELKDAAADVLEENDINFTLPERAFVFLVHQGYAFMYFMLDEETDDPPVFKWSEDDFSEPYLYKDGPIKEWNHLSEVLTDFILIKEGEQAQRQFLEDVFR